MEATNVVSGGIAQELLTKDNYKRWKILMRNYLLGKNLWTVVHSDSVSTEDGARRNAEALHIIQLSCGSKIFDEISSFSTAKAAWNHLATRYGSELQPKPDIEQGECECEGGVVDDINLHEYKDLYWYVRKGDWTKAESFIRGKKSALYSAMASGRTALHVATMEGHVNVVEGLVKEGEDRLVEMQDERGYTALAVAANYTGNVDVAKCMVEEKGGGVRQKLLAIKNGDGEIPVVMAAGKGYKDMTRYLYHKTPTDVLNGHDSRNRVLLFARCVEAQIFDVALGLLESYPELPTESLSDGFRALQALAQMPSAFLSGCRYGILKRIIYRIACVEKRSHDRYGFASTAIVPGKVRRKPNPADGRLYRIVTMVFNTVVGFRAPRALSGIRDVHEQKCILYEVREILKYLKHSVATFSHFQLLQGSVYDAMLNAAKHGNIEFINAMREANPDLLWSMDSLKRGIFSYAVLHRKHNVFKLIYTVNGRKDIIKCGTDVFGNNLLHLAGHLGPSSELKHINGPLLQMRREVQWFKAVEKIVHPKCKEAKNDDDKKPHELFTEMHKELVKSGEQWTKETARSLILVGTLITTILFSMILTVNTKFHHATWISAVSLTCSAFSVTRFIWCQTSRYDEKDFLILPTKFLSGTYLLYLSMMSIMYSLLYIALEKHRVLLFVTTFLFYPFGIILTFPLLDLVSDVGYDFQNPLRIA